MTRTSVLSALLLATLSTACVKKWDNGPTTTTAAAKKLDVTGAGAALERVTAEPVDEYSPSASPDGNTVLFEVETHAADDEEGVTPTKAVIIGVNPSTRAQRTIYTTEQSLAHDPVWMPDGSSVVFASTSTGRQSLVRTLTAAPNAAVSIVIAGEIAANPHTPTVSPDGKRVAFATFTKAGGFKIATVGVDGSRLTMLGDGRHPSWSPDGKRLAFVRQVGAFSHIFLLDPETGSDLVQLTSGDYNHDSPSWSPDAQYLAFTTDRTQASRAAKGRWVAAIVKRDGTELTQLTTGEGGVFATSWSRDNWIYFSSPAEGNHDIWRVRPGGKYATLKPAEVAKPADPAPAPPVKGGCTKDTDCKGDRVCEAGACVSPKK